MNEVTNLREIQFKSDVPEAIELFKEQIDDFSGVIILGCRKDSSLHIAMSSISPYQQAVLSCFFQAYMSKQFIINGEQT